MPPKPQNSPIYRPVDLAREHGLSAQAIRNYEDWGVLPAAHRTGSGHRRYGEVHAAALHAFMALRVSHGHPSAVAVMRALCAGDDDAALALLDAGHEQLARDRGTLDSLTTALGHLPDADAVRGAPRPHEPWSIGDLAHRLGVTPATLRFWERAGILHPARDPATGFRSYGQADVEDADLAHLLRRGGYRLDAIGPVLERIRGAGGPDAVAAALDDWRARLRERGLAMIASAARLDEFLRLRAADGRASSRSGADTDPPCPR